MTATPRAVMVAAPTVAVKFVATASSIPQAMRTSTNYAMTATTKMEMAVAPTAPWNLAATDFGIHKKLATMAIITAVTVAEMIAWLKFAVMALWTPLRLFLAEARCAMTATTPTVMAAATTAP
jgi:hypothetical protein